MRFVLATSKCKLFSMSWSRCYNSVSKSRLQIQTFRTFKFILTSHKCITIFRKKSLLTLHLPNSLLGTDLVTMALFTIGTAPFRKSISGAEKIKKLQRKEGKSLFRKVLEKCLNSMQYISVSAGFDRMYREVQLISYKILNHKKSLFLEKWQKVCSFLVEVDSNRTNFKSIFIKFLELFSPSNQLNNKFRNRIE